MSKPKGYVVQLVYGGYLMPGPCVAYTRNIKKARVYARRPRVYADERVVPVSGSKEPKK